MSLQDPATRDFVMLVVAGLLVLVVVLPPLYRRQTGRYGHRAPMAPRTPSRASGVGLSGAPGIRCVHCTATVPGFAAMDRHLKFECPVLREKRE